jgi:hypothetical protein
MRKSVNKVTILTFLLLLAIAGCTKKDYREKYTGDFFFTTKGKVFSLSDTTIDYYGSITNGPDEHGITFHYMPGYTMELAVTESGELSKIGFGGLGGHLSGKFDGHDYVTINIYQDNGFDYTITGTR